MNNLNDWEKARREEELNQELKRQNNLLEQQRWEQQFSNQKQQAALDEQNRLAREQQETLKERNELERQRQWDEESRHQRELELRIEQQYKDNTECRQTSFLAFVFFAFQKYFVSSSDIPTKNRI